MQSNLTPQRPSLATPGSAMRYRNIEDVLNDQTLDAQQKRAILSSWASDLWAIESCPWLREVPGIATPLRVSDILAALRTLDNDPPPRGGASAAVIDVQNFKMGLAHGRRPVYLERRQGVTPLNKMRVVASAAGNKGGLT